MGSKKLLASVRMQSETLEKLSETPVRIRVATPEDSLRLSAFARKCFSDTFEGTTSDDNLREYLASAFSEEIQLQEILDTQSTILLATTTASRDESGNAADREGQKEVWLGYGRVIESEPEDCVTGPVPKIELQRLYVDRSVTRGGIGSKLLLASMEEVVERGGKTAWLGVWEYNYRAMAFYERHGFTKCGGHPFLLGTDAQTDLIYQLKLP